MKTRRDPFAGSGVAPDANGLIALQHGMITEKMGESDLCGKRWHNGKQQDNH
jgi:hypothetical protein